MKFRFSQMSDRVLEVDVRRDAIRGIKLESYRPTSVELTQSELSYLTESDSKLGEVLHAMEDSSTWLIKAKEQECLLNSMLNRLTCCKNCISLRQSIQYVCQKEVTIMLIKDKPMAECGMYKPMEVE